MPAPGAERDDGTPWPQADPLHRCRRLLTKAEERLDDKGRDKLIGLLKAGDPKGDVATMWKAKEAVRELYAHRDPDLALQWVTELRRGLQDKDDPVEARSLGRTLERWKHQIAAWHAAQVSNEPTEAVYNLIKRVKRAAFGFTSFRNYRIRSLLYAGKPNWDLLKTIKPAVLPKTAKPHRFPESRQSDRAERIFKCTHRRHRRSSRPRG